MHENELWQVFNDNGSPIIGKGATTDEFKADPHMIMGNVHVWFWKKSGNNIAILLQKRSLTKSTMPGWYHISASGHINVGESSLQAALRETEEEMGISLDESKLHYVQSTRIIARAPNDIKNVYLYRLTGEEKFTYTDGEVGSLEWRTLDNFKEICKDAENNKLINMGSLYFDTLITSLEYIVSTDS